MTNTYGALDQYMSYNPITVHTLATGGDIAAALSAMRWGDVLQLSAGGAYTVPKGSNGFEGVISGRSYQHTRIIGNGATVTGGAYALYLSGKTYIDFENINFGEGSSFVGYIATSSYITLTDCSFVSETVPTFYDVFRAETCNNLTFVRCNAHTFSGRETTDGFEFWGPCSSITMTECTAYGFDWGENDDWGHGFEVYGESALQICDGIHFVGCVSYDNRAGFSSEGGPLGLAAHTNIVCNGCSGSGNALADFRGAEGATLYRTNSPGTTDGSVVDL